METLSQRYRVLDALIKGLYPDRDTNNIETLFAIAEETAISLPNFDEQSVVDEVFSNPLKYSEHSPEQLPERSPSTKSKSPDSQPATIKKVAEEKLVPLPYGPSHYIGPSSSFGFVLAVRRMVAQVNSALSAVQPDDERSKLSSDFAGSNWSKALELVPRPDNPESPDQRDASGSGVPNGIDAPPCADGLPQSKKTVLLSLLPTREVSDAFIEAYFERVHPNYLLFHRETFQVRYEAMWAHPKLLLKDVEAGWVCCIFMMLVFGAQALEDRDKEQSVLIQRHYLNHVQSRMHQILKSATLINVQAILLLQLYQHNCTERNSAFILLGCASRMAMALGMHREGTSGGFDELEREIRKRIWWTAYTFEQNQCAILGRPCAIEDAEVNATFPNEHILDGSHFVPPGYVEQSVRLSRILSSIRRNIYASPENTLNSKTTLAMQFLLELDAWQHALPHHLRLEYPSHSPRHRRAVALLQVQFYNTQALVSRPFILRKVGVELARKLGKHVRSQDLDDEELRLSDACGNYSKSLVLLLHQLIVDGMFEGVAWMDAYYLYHGVFILALDFLARPWNSGESDEDLSRKDAVRGAMGALRRVNLCPTFTILTQVSLQLAKIVGIFDTPVTQPPEPNHYIPHQPLPLPPPYTLPAQVSLPQAGVEHAVTSWFRNKAPDEIPWDLRDYFGADGYIGPTDHNVFNMPLNIYTNHMPGAPEEEELVSPLPLSAGYTHWGPVDPRFAQQAHAHQPGHVDLVYKREIDVHR